MAEEDLNNNSDDFIVVTKPKKYHEVRDLIIAWIAISICFTIVLGGFHLFAGIKNKWIFEWAKLPTYLLISLIVTGTSFVLHELAHKYSAIRLGAKAQFVMWKNSLLLSIGISALIGFVFVAPGAVYIYGKHLSVREDGITSLAGPLINIIMGLLFIIVFVILGSPQTGLLATIFVYGIFINFWIAFFNLLPIGPLDGKKIMVWKPFLWGFLLLVSVVFVFVL